MTISTHRLVLGLIAVSVAVPAAAMPVRDFLPRAERLMKAGVGAVFSADRKPVMAEVKRVGRVYKADIEGAKAAGRTPRSCPPAKSKLDGKAFLAYLHAMPASQRGMDMTEALHRYMATEHPC